MQDSKLVALVEQLALVNADQIIAVRVSSETKARLRAFAERQQLSESALLRRLVELVLLKAGLTRAGDYLLLSCRPILPVSYSRTRHGAFA